MGLEHPLGKFPAKERKSPLDVESCRAAPSSSALVESRFLLLLLSPDAGLLSKTFFTVYPGFLLGF